VRLPFVLLFISFSSLAPPWLPQYLRSVVGSCIYRFDTLLPSLVYLVSMADAVEPASLCGLLGVDVAVSDLVVCLFALERHRRHCSSID
jgi:hypothetical protein